MQTLQINTQKTEEYLFCHPTTAISSITPRFKEPCKFMYSGKQYTTIGLALLVLLLITSCKDPELLQLGSTCLSNNECESELCASPNAMNLGRCMQSCDELGQGCIRGGTCFEDESIEGITALMCPLPQDCKTGSCGHNGDCDEATFLCTCHAPFGATSIAACALCHPDNFFKDCEVPEGESDCLCTDLSGLDLSTAVLDTEPLTGAVYNSETIFPGDFAHTSAGMMGPKTQLAGKDLSGRKLSDLDLSEANLDWADLSNADLSNSILRGASLKNADLTGANLENCDLSGADLRSADMRSTTLIGVDLTGAQLEGTNLIGVDLSLVIGDLPEWLMRSINEDGISDPGLLEALVKSGELTDLAGANLSGTTFSEFDFSGMELTRINLSECNLEMARFDSATLDFANFGQANLAGASFIQADLTGARFTEANLTQTNFADTDISGGSLAGANLSGASFGTVDLSEATLEGAWASDRVCDGVLVGCNEDHPCETDAECPIESSLVLEFHNVDFNSSKLQTVRFGYSFITECSLIGANLEDGYFDSSDFTGSVFTGAKLSGADFSRASLQSTELSDANLVGVIFSEGTRFDSANLSHSNLSNQNLQGTDFIDTDLTEAVLTGANLTNSNLMRADFSNAIMSGVVMGCEATNSECTPARAQYARFIQTDLSSLTGQMTQLGSVDLRNCHMTGVNLSRALMEQTDLRSSDLTSTIISGANLSGALLTDVNLSDADLSDTNLSGVILSETLLNRAVFRRSDLSDCDLSDAELQGVTIDDCDLSGANLSRANLSQSTISGTIGTEDRPALLIDTQLQGSRLDANFDNANLCRANLEGSLLMDSSFGNTEWIELGTSSNGIYSIDTLVGAIRNSPPESLACSYLANGDFSGLTLSRVDFSSASLKGVNFTNSNLEEIIGTEAILRNANLTGVGLNSADLTGADLTDSAGTPASTLDLNLSDTNLCGVDWSRGLQNQGAFLSAGTICPPKSDSGECYLTAATLPNCELWANCDPDWAECDDDYRWCETEADDQHCGSECSDCQQQGQVCLDLQCVDNN